MRIAVAGLGLMGASLARALKANTDYIVDGWNRNPGVTDYAVERGYLDGAVKDFAEYDVVFLALPPDVTMDFLETKAFADNAVVADLCGVKKPVEDAVYAEKRNYRYVGTHPMAGKEKGGIKHSCPDLFKGANVILTRGRYTDEDALNIVARIYRKIGCGKILLCPADYHDAKIAYTSQLAHIVSNAYLKSKTAKGCEGFTGGSFQDMTRVGGVDEEMWTQLYFLNEENLIGELETLIANLGQYLSALKDGNEEKMKELLREGSAVRNALKCYKD